MTTEEIKQLLEKYNAAETSRDEEQLLAAYFNQPDVDSELKPFMQLFRQFAAEKQVQAPTSSTNKLKAAQQRTKSNRVVRIRYISMGIAASLLIMLGIGLFRHTATKNPDFVMYSNGKRVNDPVAALEFTRKEFSKVSATLNKTNTIMAKPINTINHSLEPLRKTKKQLEGVEKIFLKKVAKK